MLLSFLPAKTVEFSDYCVYVHGKYKGLSSQNFPLLPYIKFYTTEKTMVFSLENTNIESNCQMLITICLVNPVLNTIGYTNKC